MAPKEKIIVDDETGGKKAGKIWRFDLIPTAPLWELAKVYGHGAKKYEVRNWEKGYDWGLSMAALERHYQAFKGGEDNDPEKGTHHLAHVIFHAMALMEYQRNGLGNDSRSKLEFHPGEELDE